MIRHLTIRQIVSDIRCKKQLKYPLSTIRPKLTIVRALVITLWEETPKCHVTSFVKAWDFQACFQLNQTFFRVFFQSIIHRNYCGQCSKRCNLRYIAQFALFASTGKSNVFLKNFELSGPEEIFFKKRWLKPKITHIHVFHCNIFPFLEHCVASANTGLKNLL